MTNQKSKNYATVPEGCHLWKQKKPKIELELVKKYPESGYATYADESMRSLKKCGDCGQLYFCEMVEFRDREDGRDPVYRTYIPVSSEANADELAKISEIKIAGHTPQIRNDWPKDGKKTIQWFKE